MIYTVLSVLDYGDIIYTLYLTAPQAIVFLLTTLSPLSSLANRREQHCMLFIFKALPQRLPAYLFSFTRFKHSTYNIRSQDFLTIPVKGMVIIQSFYALTEHSFYYKPHSPSSLHRHSLKDVFLYLNTFFNIHSHTQTLMDALGATRDSVSCQGCFGMQTRIAGESIRQPCDGLTTRSTSQFPPRFKYLVS